MHISFCRILQKSSVVQKCPLVLNQSGPLLDLIQVCGEKPYGAILHLVKCVDTELNGNSGSFDAAVLMTNTLHI